MIINGMRNTVAVNISKRNARKNGLIYLSNARRSERGIINEPPFMLQVSLTNQLVGSKLISIVMLWK